MLKRIVLLGIAAASMACGCGRSTSPAPPPDPLWQMVRLMRTASATTIPEADAEAFWGTTAADGPLSVTVGGTLGLAEKPDLQFLRATGRRFNIEGETVSLFARSWQVGSLQSASLISYAVVRGNKRIDWAELFVEPSWLRPSGDALGSSLADGLYAYLVGNSRTPGISTLTVEDFNSRYVVGGATPSHALTTCSIDEAGCGFGVALAGELIRKDACVGVAVAAGISAGATCTFSGVAALLTPACVEAATVAAYFGCDFVSGVVEGTVVGGVCSLLVNCAPGHSPACSCPFDGVCRGGQALGQALCESIATYALCNVVAHIPAGTLSRWLPAQGSWLEKTVLPAACGSVGGLFSTSRCEEVVDLSCPAADGGVDAESQLPPDAAIERASSDGGAIPDAPERPPGTTSSISLGVGNNNVILRDGTVKGWGSFAVGMVAADPVLVTGISTAVMLTVGNGYTCALLADGAVSCWGGDAGEGGLANPVGTMNLVPTPVKGLDKAVFINAGIGGTSCAILEDRALRCWGSGRHGQLGTGYTISRAPVPVKGVPEVLQVSTGADHVCAVLPDRSVRCWGSNAFDQLAVARTTLLASSTPIEVKNLAPATAVAVGDHVSCAIVENGSVRCWGDNANFRLGPAQYNETPVEVPGLSDVRQLAVAVHGCALLGDGSVRCWGPHRTNGPVVAGANTVAVSGISQATAIAVGVDYSCAVLADGTVRCWGAPGPGLGSRTNPAVPGTPVMVTGITDAR
jgi:alpha-tubulin suppressor-like RCC1 family protein